MKSQFSLHLKKLFSFYKTFFAALLLLSIFSQNSYAALDYGAGRLRSCNVENGISRPEGLDFNPTFGGKDIEFVLSNPVCVTVILTSYAAVKINIAAMNYVCGGSPVPRLLPSPFLDAYDIGKASITGDLNCKTAAAVAGISLATALAELGIIYGIANDAYETTSVCGSGWMQASEKTSNFSAAGYKKTVQNQIDAWLRDGENDKLNFSEKKYREWYYGGIEYEDNPDTGETCYDPTKSAASPYPKQKFYLKGLETGNFHCRDYLILEGKNDPVTGAGITPNRLADFNAAYECCNRRSREYICISTQKAFASVESSGTNNVFCKGGTRCTIEGITYSTKFLDNDRLVCAESYSLCPYNFTVGGGTEYCNYYRDGIYDEDSDRWDMITAEQVEDGLCQANSEIRNTDCTYNDKAGKCVNYCQYLTHCTKTSSVNPYVSGLTSPYFSEACLNFEGDSQNKASFGGDVVIGNQKHFSAPIAQCVKETLENVFYNKAGHSKCLNINEYPSKDGTCPSGLYVTDGTFIFQKGNKVTEASFFERMQNTLQLVVKLVLTFSIMLYGMNLLMWKTDIRNKKDILIYLFKIALVLYFATGDAWQSTFFEGVYGASTEFSRMVFKIKTQEDQSLRDGCQFGRVYLPDGTETYSDKLYPQGKEYLSIWDTLDCKIMRYLGFGPQASAANITMLILASFFTGPIGIYFALSVLIFGILLIAATLRALHIFLSSAVSIIIMVFVSPVIIPLLLFEKTKSIFDNWLKELISFCLQPMILFAYIAIFIMVIDQTLVGSATFSGNAPFKTMNCAQRCVGIDGGIVAYDGDQPPACDDEGQKIVNPMTDSVACLIGFDNFGKFPGFEIIGIALPVAFDLILHDTKAKVLTLLKGTLVMYLMYKFMDEIPGITSALIGGTPLPTSKADGFSMFKKLLGAARGVQKRLARGSKKGVEKLRGKAREGIEESSNKGKKTEGTGSGGDNVKKGGLGSGGDNAGGGQGGQGSDKANDPQAKGSDGLKDDS